MANKDPIEPDISVGTQDYLSITRLTGPTPIFDIVIRGLDGGTLYPFRTSDLRDKTSVVVLVAQEMAKDPHFGFGRDQIPYRWTDGRQWTPVERWLSSLDYSMHALIRTSVNRRNTADSLAFEVMSAWQANSTYPGDGLPLRAMGMCRGIPFLDHVLVPSDGTWNVEPHKPENFNTRVIAMEADAAVAMFIEMSNGLCADSKLVHLLTTSLTDAQQIAFRRWLGYHLVSTQVPNAEQMMYLWGAGGNGKSQLLELIRGLVGRDSSAELRLSDLRTSANIELLGGKVAMIGGEANTSTDLETLKSLISREPLNCNPKYRDPFTVVPECLVTQASNKPPAFRERSDAMVRRVISMKLEESFTHETKRIPDIGKYIVEHEYHLLVGLALWGAYEVIEAGGLVVPDEIQEQSRTVVESGNDVADFFAMLEFGPFEIAVGELYACYSRWTSDAGRGRNALDRGPLIDEVLRMASARRRPCKQTKASKYTPQRWYDKDGDLVKVIPTLQNGSRPTVIQGLRVVHEAFGQAVGMEMSPNQINRHLFDHTSPVDGVEDAGDSLK